MTTYYKKKIYVIISLARGTDVDASYALETKWKQVQKFDNLGSVLTDGGKYGIEMGGHLGIKKMPTKS